MSASVLVSLMVVIIAFGAVFLSQFPWRQPVSDRLCRTVLVCLCTPGRPDLHLHHVPALHGQHVSAVLPALHHRRRVRLLCLMESGLGDAMATHMIKIFGEKWIAVALFVITCLMMAAGVASLPVRCPGHLPARTEKS